MWVEGGGKHIGFGNLESIRIAVEETKDWGQEAFQNFLEV